MKTTPEAPRHDWSRFDAMTDGERHAAAVKDPDAAASAHLTVMGRNPVAVTEALHPTP